MRPPTHSFNSGGPSYFCVSIGEGDTVMRKAIAMQRKVRKAGSEEEADALRAFCRISCAMSGTKEGTVERNWPKPNRWPAKD